VLAERKGERGISRRGPFLFPRDSPSSLFLALSLHQCPAFSPARSLARSLARAHACGEQTGFAIKRISISRNARDRREDPTYTLKLDLALFSLLAACSLSPGLPARALALSPTRRRHLSLNVSRCFSLRATFLSPRYSPSRSHG